MGVSTPKGSFDIFLREQKKRFAATTKTQAENCWKKMKKSEKKPYNEKSNMEYDIWRKERDRVAFEMFKDGLTEEEKNGAKGKWEELSSEERQIFYKRMEEGNKNKREREKKGGRKREKKKKKKKKKS